MKKLLIYSWLPCLLAMFMCTTFTACDDDDDDNGSVATSLVGKWKFAGDLNGAEEYLVFNSDGTGYCEQIEPDGTTYKYEFTYKQEGDFIMLSGADGFMDEDEGVIKYITDRDGKKALDIGEDGYYYKV